MKYFIFLFVFAVCFFSCKNIAAGSYPYAEIYQYNIDYDTLINALINLKERDSSLKVPSNLGLNDGKSGSTDYWYHFYFFNRKKNEIIHAWVREGSKTVTNLAFVGVNKGLQLGNWKEINKDFTKTENLRQKEEFKRLILNKIKYPLME